MAPAEHVASTQHFYNRGKTCACLVNCTARKMMC